MRSRLRPVPGQIALGLVDDAGVMCDTLVGHLQGERRRAKYIREMGMHRGAARIDLAVVDDSLDGYEIKSPRDDLRRLAAQVSAYSQVFDHLTLVGTEHHLEGAARTVPRWWGLTVMDVRTSMVHVVRSAAPNPGPDPAALVHLLWREEMLEVLEARTGKTPSGHNGAVRQRLMAEMSADEVRATVRRCLSERRGWPAAG